MTLRIKLKLSPKSDAMLLDVKKGTKIENIMLNYKGQYKYPVLLAKKDNEIVELTDKIYEECEITMLDMTYPSVEFAYQRNLSLLYARRISAHEGLSRRGAYLQRVCTLPVRAGESRTDRARPVS